MMPGSWIGAQNKPTAIAAKREANVPIAKSIVRQYYAHER